MVLDFEAFTTAIVVTATAAWKQAITASIVTTRIANAIGSTINWNIIAAVVITYIVVITLAGGAIVSS
jgi:hypothetical protein